MTDKHIPVEKLEVLLKDATYHPKLGYVVPAIAIRQMVDACKENPFDYTSPPADNLIAELQATIDRLTSQRDRLFHELKSCSSCVPFLRKETKALIAEIEGHNKYAGDE